MPTPHGADNLTHIMPNRPLRVCFVIDQLGIAGIETQVLKLIGSLHRETIQPHLCILRDSGHQLANLSLEACPILLLNLHHLRSPFIIGNIRQYCRFLHDYHIDIVHALTPDATYFATPIAKFSGRKTVGFRVNLGYNHGRYDGFLLPWYHRFFLDALIANCEACKDSVVMQERARRSRVSVIPNILPDLSSLLALPFPNLDRQIPPHRVGMLANLRPVKSPETFLDAAAMIVKKRPETLFQIAGGGDIERYRKEITVRGLSDSVQLLGPIKEITSFLDTLDVAVLTSSSEGSPNVIMEYMAAGRPIVSTNVGGIPELLTHQQHGLLIPPHNPHALSESILYLLDNPEEGLAMAKRAREKAIKEFAPEKVVNQYETFYHSLLSPKKQLSPF